MQMHLQKMIKIYCGRLCSQPYTITYLARVINDNSRHFSRTCTKLLPNDHSGNGSDDNSWNSNGERESQTSITSNLVLDLAKPTRKFHVNKKVKMSKREIQILKYNVEDLGSEVVKAVRGVAKAANKISECEGQQVQSDLLRKLKKDHKETERRQALGDIFAGMNIDKELQHESLADTLSKKEVIDQQATHSYQMSQAQQHQSVDLYSGELLNLFQHMPDKSDAEKSATPIWDELEKQELEQLVSQPPRNGWEEMIVWTKQGKLWNFPIDNEQGMDEERAYRFDEHVMLDRLLQDGFPKRGPVRHFMDVVVTGLSKNYYLTVPEKRAHIAWYREYFEQHKELLDTVIQDTAGGGGTPDTAASDTGDAGARAEGSIV